MQILSSDPVMPYDHQPALADALATSPVASTTPLASPDRDPWLPGRLALLLEDQSRATGPEPSSSQTVDTVESFDTSHPLSSLSRSFSGPVGYLANRWNTGGSFSASPPSLTKFGGDDSQRHESVAPSSSCSSTASAPILPPPNSHRQFRLSLSLDGKAEVRSGFSPSPPRPQAPPPSTDSSNTLPPLPRLRRPSLHRSHSALPSVTLPPISTLTGSLTPNGPQRIPKLGRGRSRDVHAWELACDAGSREDELTAQAQHESSGSATAAISLLRSASDAGSILQANSSKRNAPWSRPASRTGGVKKPKLGRASSSSSASTGRAPSRSAPVLAPAEKSAIADDGGDPKKLKVSTLLAISGNDSDKENWSPDEDGHPSSHPHRPTSTIGRRPLPSAAPRNPRRTVGRVLDDIRGGGPPFLSAQNRAQTAPPRRQGGKQLPGLFSGELEIFEDASSPAGDTAEKGKPSVENDGDKAAPFMHGTNDISPSKKGYLDCVAGLLSLSQGNWR